jgi:hypothetical protein
LTFIDQITNIWGTFDVERESGLPVLPEGQYWKLVKADTSQYYYLKWMKQEEETVKRLFRKPVTRPKDRLIGKIIKRESELSRTKLQLSACQLLVSLKRDQKAKADSAEYIKSMLDRPIITSLKR